MSFEIIKLIFINSVSNNMVMVTDKTRCQVHWIIKFRILNIAEKNSKWLKIVNPIDFWDLNEGL